MEGTLVMLALGEVPAILFTGMVLPNSSVDQEKIQNTVSSVKFSKRILMTMTDSLKFKIV